MHDETDDRELGDPELINLRLRVFCHWLIDHVSNEDLSELALSVLETVESRLGARHALLLEPSRKTLTATINDSYERPEFHAVEE